MTATLDKKDPKYLKKIELMLWRDACKRSFWCFSMYAFGCRKYCKTHPAEDWIDREKHRYLCDWLQAKILEWEATRTTRHSPMRLLILMPRGTAKTTLVTEALTLWLHLRNPEMSTFIDSYVKDKSIDFLGVLQRVMAGETGHAWFSKLYGRWKPDNDPHREWRKEACVHTRRKDLERQSPSFECTSVATGITGHHPDHIAQDDPITEDKLREDENWLPLVAKHQTALGYALLENGLHVLVMTPYREGDCSADAMIKGKVRSFANTGCLPREDAYVLDPENGAWDVFFLPGRDANSIPQYPKVWSEERMLKDANLNPLEHASQVQLDPTVGSNQELSAAQIQRMLIPQKDAPKNLRASIHCDIAWKDEKSAGKGDFNTIQVWGHEGNGSGKVGYLEGWRSNKAKSKEFMNQLVIIIKRLDQALMFPFIVTYDQETGGSKGAFENLLTNACIEAGIRPPACLGIPRGRADKKINRHRDAAAYWRQGKVWLVEGAPELSELIKEMLRIGLGGHDDMRDPAADVFHKDVYIPQTHTGRDPQPPDPSRPYDRELQGVNRIWGADDIRQLYDEYTEQSEIEVPFWRGN